MAGQTNFAELYKRTTAPFAIDLTGISTRVKTRIRRPIGVGSIEYVVSGKGTVTENNVTVHVKAGDVFILHAGQYHDYAPDPDDPWTKIWVQTSGPAVKEILRAYGLAHVNHIPDFNLSEDLFRIHHLINKDTDLETIDKEGPRLFLELVQKIHDELRLREQQTRKPQLAEIIRKRIDELSDGYTTLEQLAEEFHFSKQYIIRIFKERYGITPHDYIINRRIAIAQSLLKKTELSIKNIAEQLRFCDVSYFSDFFRRHVGMAPLEFRKKYKS